MTFFLDVKKKIDFNSQRLTLELSLTLSQSFQASFAIHLYHEAPSWIAWRTKSRLDGYKEKVCVTYSVLSEDFKQAWLTIIAALISAVTTNEKKSDENLSYFNFPSNDSLRPKMKGRISR